MLYYDWFKTHNNYIKFNIIFMQLPSTKLRLKKPNRYDWYDITLPIHNVY